MDAGIWLSPNSSSPPVLSVFGSTNLNARSARLDTELSFIMMTASDDIRTRLSAEVRHLREDVGPWKGAERTVPFSTKVIAALVKGML